MPLTEEQQKPINSKKDHQLILAGPGTGKSFTILGYIEHLVVQKKVKPETILVITFTRKAAHELKKKISKLLKEQESSPRVFTLHSFALRQLVRNSKKISSLPPGFSIANDFEERHIIMEDLKVLLGIKIKEVRNLFNLLSANWETLNAEKTDWETSFDNPAFLGAWQEHRSIYGYMLRSELVYQFKKALEQDEKIELDIPIGHLIVDEYQDLNKCDLAVINHLRKGGTRVFCAGDDDQSIYGFRFAYPEGIRNFSKEVENSEDFKLTECFRCDENILKLAMMVIGQDPKRIPKKLVSMSRLNGEYHLLAFLTQNSEAEKIAELIQDLITKKGIPANEIIILLRSDHHGNFSSPILDQLKHRGITIDYGTDVNSLFDNDTGRYFLALLKFFKNTQDDLSLRTIFELTNGLGASTFQSIYAKAREQRKRFHEIVESIAKGELDEITNSKKLKEVLASLYDLKGQLEKEEDILAALEKLKSIVPQWSEEFAQKMAGLIAEKEIKNVTELIEYTNEILGPDKEPADEAAAGVRIMSMHQAKGLTAQAVFVVAAEEEYTPGRGDVDEERRLLYVSLTRAQHYLFITYCRDRTGAQSHSGFLMEDNTTRRHLTRFLRDLPIIPPQTGTHFKLT